MIVIVQDPAEVIPDICEDDINTKIILMKCYIAGRINHAIYYAMLKFDEESELSWYGHERNDFIFEEWYGYHGNNVIEMLINTWHSIYSYDKIIWVIENTDELMEVLYANGITGQAFDTIVAECKKVIR